MARFSYDLVNNLDYPFSYSCPIGKYINISFFESSHRDLLAKYLFDRGTFLENLFEA